MEKRRYNITTRDERCKGCNICVHYCPRNVLELQDDKVRVMRPEECIGCMLCELRCPDYAIVVEEEGNNGEEIDAGK